MSETVTVNGKHYSRHFLETLSRDEVRELARWVQAHERRSASLVWIGTAGKHDLIRFLLQEIEAVAPANSAGNGQASTPNASVNAASLLQQAIEAISASQEAAIDENALNERLDAFKRESDEALYDRTNAIVKEVQIEFDAVERKHAEELAALRAEFEAIVAKGPKPTRVEVVVRDQVTYTGVAHKQFPELLKLLSARICVALVGPAGSGKTKAFAEAAKVLGLEFEALSVGPQTTQSQLLGYMDAKGDYVSTAVRRRYQGGGLLLLDEFDAGNAGVQTSLNSILGNDRAGFPDDLVYRHSTNLIGASLNTFGQGASRKYCGRMPQDAATLDRFFFLEWNYDEALEREIALQVNPEAGAWVTRVQELRRNAERNGLEVVISPRASEMGAAVLAQGFDFAFLEKGLIYRGHDAVTVQKIRGEI